MGGYVEYVISFIFFVFYFKFKYYIYLLVYFIDMMFMYIYLVKLLKNNVFQLYMMKVCWNKNFLVIFVFIFLLV